MSFRFSISNQFFESINCWSIFLRLVANALPVTVTKDPVSSAYLVIIVTVTGLFWAGFLQYFGKTTLLIMQVMNQEVFSLKSQ